VAPRSRQPRRRPSEAPGGCPSLRSASGGRGPSDVVLSFRRSRAAGCQSPFGLELGAPGTPCRFGRPVSAPPCMRCLARRVACRRPPRSSASSPSTAPGATSATAVPSTSTESKPSIRRNSSLPRSPCGTRTCPASRRSTVGPRPTMRTEISRSTSETAGLMRAGVSMPPRL
jgi:hypothetical protein